MHPFFVAISEVQQIIWNFYSISKSKGMDDFFVCCSFCPQISLQQWPVGEPEEIGSGFFLRRFPILSVITRAIPDPASAKDPRSARCPFT
jgi:hypothetical protein